MTTTTRAAFAAFLFAFGAAITSQTANATMGHHKAAIIRAVVTDTTVSIWYQIPDYTDPIPAYHVSAPTHISTNSAPRNNDNTGQLTIGCPFDNHYTPPAAYGTPAPIRRIPSLPRRGRPDQPIVHTDLWPGTQYSIQLLTGFPANARSPIADISRTYR